MADSLKAKWPVAELSDDGKYLAPKEVASLYDMKYSTFMKRLKDFVQYGDYPAGAFQVNRMLGPEKRDYWLIEVHPVLGIRALNRHFYPRLVVQ
jgi:hypothetical protein